MSDPFGEPADAQPPGPDRRAVTDHDRRRLRITYRVVVGAVVLGILAAGGVGLLGASGGAGLAVLLVLSSAGCVAAAFVTALLAIVDEWRRAPVARRRAWTALGLAVLGALLLVMSLGPAAAA